MPRHPARLLTLALITTLLLIPTLATAHPAQKTTIQPPQKRPTAAPDLLTRLQGLLSALWAETGSILDPNGSNNDTSPTSEPGTQPTSDTGSILDPNG
jgi:hypothetical protein